jgi:hypothetical protein
MDIFLQWPLFKIKELYYSQHVKDCVLNDVIYDEGDKDNHFYLI